MSDDDRDPETIEKTRRGLDAYIEKLTEEVEEKKKILKYLNLFKQINRERAEALKPVHQWKWYNEMAREFAQPGLKDEPFLTMKLFPFM